jgi:hypothetical protein
MFKDVRVAAVASRVSQSEEEPIISPTTAFVGVLMKRGYM